MVRFLVFVLSLVILYGCNTPLPQEEVVQFEQDYQALVEFYQAMGGDEWIDNTNW